MARYRRTLIFFIAIVALCSVFAADARPLVIITVDVESRSDLSLPIQIDAVCADGSRCGLMAIARMLEDRHISGTYFLNVYEYKAWGESAMRSIALQLQAHGQDVALHTHPQWAYDPNRPNMYDYNIAEQTRIIADGVQLLAAWTGLPVVAHRAGAYTADSNTIKALAANGIHLDSSLFFRYPKSRLNGLGLPNNLPSTIGAVREIPVTVYERAERPVMAQQIAPPVKDIRKIDPDWFLNETEARLAIDAAIEADLPFLVIFLHSFTFIAEAGTNNTPLANTHTKAVFAAMLDHIASSGLKTVTMRNVAASPSLIITKRDVIPQVAIVVPTYRYIKGSVRSYATARNVALVCGAAAIALGGAFVIIARRRRLRAQLMTSHSSRPE